MGSIAGSMYFLSSHYTDILKGQSGGAFCNDESQCEMYNEHCKLDTNECVACTTNDHCLEDHGPNFECWTDYCIEMSDPHPEPEQMCEFCKTFHDDGLPIMNGVIRLQKVATVVTKNWLLQA